MYEEIQNNMIENKNLGYTIKFLWIPSHIRHQNYDTVDKLANEACTESPETENLGISIRTIKTMLKQEWLSRLDNIRDTERAESSSIKHYDNFRHIEHKYGKSKYYTRECDKVAVRVRLGYRYTWEIAHPDIQDTNVDNEQIQNGVIQYTKCKLCDQAYKHTLPHYIVECKEIEDFRPNALNYYELCQHFVNVNVLSDILELYPDFASPETHIKRK